MTFLSSTLFLRFCLFLLSQIFYMMTYMALSSREKPLFHNKILHDTFFQSIRTFARVRQHYFSKYWEDGCMGRRPPPQIWGDRPPVSPNSPPTAKGSSVLYFVRSRAEDKVMS